MVMTQAFNGAGDTWTTTRINLFIFWLWEIPLAYWLSRRAGMGPRGVFAAIAIAFSTLAVVSVTIYGGILPEDGRRRRQDTPHPALPAARFARRGLRPRPALK
jgi:hypothetical protein